jgi:hypothetical protein
LTGFDAFDSIALNYEPLNYEPYNFFCYDAPSKFTKAEVIEKKEPTNIEMVNMDILLKLFKDLTQK